MDVTWTRKRVKQLVGLRKERPPPTKIGRLFTKNAVIGMPGEPQFGASSDGEPTIGNIREVRATRKSRMSCGR